VNIRAMAVLGFSHTFQRCYLYNKQTTVMEQAGMNPDVLIFKQTMQIYYYLKEIFLVKPI
jgi:hypothetical protein